MSLTAHRSESLAETAAPVPPQHLSTPKNFYASSLALKVKASSALKTGTVLDRWPAVFARDEAGLVGKWLVEAKTLMAMVLLLAVIISGVAAIYAVHLNRQLFVELQVLQAEQDQAQRRWTQLLLEESALNAPNRVELIASGKLGMVIPESGHLEMVK